MVRQGANDSALEQGVARRGTGRPQSTGGAEVERARPEAGGSGKGAHIGAAQREAREEMRQARGWLRRARGEIAGAARDVDHIDVPHTRGEPGGIGYRVEHGPRTCSIQQGARGAK
jgi:hypothetical protein